MICTNHNDAILLVKLVDNSEYYKIRKIIQCVLLLMVEGLLTLVTVAMMCSFDKQDITVGALQLQGEDHYTQAIVLMY